MSLSHLPALLSACFAACGSTLDKRSALRLPLLLLGTLLAKGRRTVTSWFRAAGVTDDFRRSYNVLWAVGRRASFAAAGLFCHAVKPLMLRFSGDQLVFAIDDTPTKRYGPCIQGAGIHHNPTPGPAGEKFLFGHLWVTLAWLGKHPLCGVLALPLQALLYIRAKDVDALNKEHPEYHWAFRTKLELAVDLVLWLLCWLGQTTKSIWIVVDGGYAKRPFLRPLLERGLTLFGRLRKDAGLRTLPPTQRRQGQPGPMPTYGKQSISLAKRAGHKRGWQEVVCTQYGRQATKTVKVFQATWEPAGGAILVVLVKELYFPRKPKRSSPNREGRSGRLLSWFHASWGVHAATSRRRWDSARKSPLVGRPAKAVSISPCKTSRCNALRLSACEGRRGSLSQGLALRSTMSASSADQAHASTMVYIHRFTLNAPMQA